MNDHMDNRPDRNRNNPENQGPNKSSVHSGFCDLSSDYSGLS